MGYRSTVIFGLKKSRKEKLNEVFKKHDLEGVYEETEAADDFILYKAEYVKWYEEYSDVADIIEVIDEAHLKDEGFMVCLGELGELHNERGEWWNFVDRVSYLEIQ